MRAARDTLKPSWKVFYDRQIRLVRVLYLLFCACGLG